MLDNPYVIPLFIAAAISGSITIFAWRHRSSPGAMPLAALTLAATVWQLAYGFELANDGLSTKILWAKVAYVGIVIVPTAWLAVTLQYTGRGRWLTRRNITLLAVLPLVTLLLAWTNGSHSLIWNDVLLDSGPSFAIAEFVHGPWFWVHGAYYYVLLILGFVFLADALLHSPRLYWKQATALFVSALVPWASNWSFSVGLAPEPNLDLTAFAFAVSSVAIAWAVLRVKLLDIAPVARNAVFENMANGALVLDGLDRVADFNSAAQRILGSSDAQVIGLPVADVWPDGPDLLWRPVGSAPEQVEFTSVMEEERRIYNVAASPLFDGSGRPAGRLVMFHDITEIKRVQMERERLFDEVSASREQLRALTDQMVKVQEAERLHLARELHDEIGQVLTGLQLTLESGKRMASDAVRSRIDEAQELVNGLVGRIRELALDLRPAMLDDLGLVPTLRWYFERYTTQTNVEVHFARAQPNERFRPEVEIAVYRIIQESLTNVARHAGASQATVRLWTASGTIGVEIQDRGAGFDTADTTKNGVSTGLLGMRERATLLGGHLEVESALGTGSTVIAKLPLGSPPQDQQRYNGSWAGS